MYTLLLKNLNLVRTPGLTKSEKLVTKNIFGMNKRKEESSF